MNETKYLQRDGRWGGLPYPSKPCYIRDVGCGEVSIANILIEMKQYANYTPKTIQPYCKRYGAPGCEGTYLSGICKMMIHYEMTDVKECDTMPKLWAEMSKGGRVAVLLMGSKPGGSKKIHWTSGGHFIAACDFKVESKKHYLYIKDPWTDAKDHNGWLSYEEYLKGDVVGVYVGKKTTAKVSDDTKSDKLVVDGIGGELTIKATQRFFGTVQNGYLEDQLKRLNEYYPSITAVKYGKGKSGSSTVKKLQKWLGLTQDGIIGKGTTAAWQHKLRDLGYLAKAEKIDGIFGVKSMKAWQKFLNENEKVVYPIEAENSIGKLANKYAWGIDDADKAKYPSGSPTDAYKAGLDKAYPNRSSWGTAPRKGASCDVFVGTCVRNSGVDKNFPRGLDEQIPYLAKSKKFKEVSVTVDTVKDGDIIIYTKESGGGHTCIAYGGKVKEAGYNNYYPKTTDYLKSRLSKKGKKWLKVYRAVTQTKKPEPTSKPPYKVIDVSDWQGKIDWKKVKADGVVGAIIRYADGTTLDQRFKENMQGAKEAGLHIGSYIFSRAKSKAQAEKEAERLYNACKPYGCDMPLYIDLEVASNAKYANTVAQAFIAKIKALGGRPGVYANLNWWNNYLKPTAKMSFAMWLAQYNSTMDYKPASYVGMWQYTSSGKVNGIKGKVDMDKCYIAYWEER